MAHRCRGLEVRAKQRMPRFSLSKQIRDPYFYPVDFDFQEEMMVFAFAEDAAFCRSLRLGAYDFPIENLKWVPFGHVYHETGRIRDSQVPSTNYLFHLPFCGSTLLTRFLEDSTLMLRDPVSLDALYFKDDKGTKFPASISRLRDVTLTLLNRRPEDRAIVVRTAGYHPELIEHLVKFRTFRSSLFLFASPRYYFAQVLKSPERRKHARLLFARRKAYTRAKTGEGLETLTDAAVVALSWIFSVEIVLRLAAGDRTKRHYTLDCEEFLAHRLKTLPRVSAAFGIEHVSLEPGRAREIDSVHAKFGQRFGEAQRRAESRRAEAAHNQEIETGLELINKVDPRGQLLAGLKRLSV